MTIKSIIGTVARWLLARSNPSYVVIYDDAEHEGEDYGEQYYGFFSSRQEAAQMFNELARPAGRYRDAKLCAVLCPVFGIDLPHMPYAPSPTIEPPAPTIEKLFTFRPRDELFREAGAGWSPPPGTAPAQGGRAAAGCDILAVFKPRRPGEDDRPPNNADLIVAAMEHLRAARSLLREAGALKTLERVHGALASADGARRHAKLAPERAMRQPLQKGGDLCS